MKLKNWLKINNMSQRYAAAMLHIHWQHLNGIVNGSRNCSPKLAFKIEALTNGEVTALELLKQDILVKAK